MTVLDGALFAALAAWIGAGTDPPRVDRAVATWAGGNVSAATRHVLDTVTWLGSIWVVVPLAVVLAATELLRGRRPLGVLFIAAIVGGEDLLSNVLKQIVDRPRPAFNPAAATLGTAFPSGHTTTAAAFYAGAAVLLAAGTTRTTRAALACAALAITVIVGASRILLDLHWLTDVLGGLLLGWGWFALCWIALDAAQRRDS